MKTTPIAKAQAKILCYYVSLGTLLLTVHSYYYVAGEVSAQAANMHYACQSAGVQSGRDCGDPPRVFLAVFR